MLKRNFSHLSDGLTVLVEEEASIRRSWAEFFEKCGMKLLVFDSAESFIADYRPNGDPVEFFFDQDFGRVRGVGTKLAAYVQTWPSRTGTSLVTSYFPEMFEAELRRGLLDGVLPKFPEEIFGEDYFDRHVDRRIAEEGLGNFMAESVGRISDAFQRFEEAIVTGTLSGGSGEAGL